MPFDTFVRAAQALAQAEVPPAVAASSPFRSPTQDRGIVVSDFLRRLVARSFAQHFATTLQEACAPFQFGVSTRAGAEAVAHTLSFATKSGRTLLALALLTPSAARPCHVARFAPRCGGQCHASFRPAILRLSVALRLA